MVLVVWCDRSGQFYKSFSNQEDGSRIDKKNVYAMELDGEAQISSHPEWRPLRLFRLIGIKRSYDCVRGFPPQPLMCCGRPRVGCGPLAAHVHA